MDVLKQQGLLFVYIKSILDEEISEVEIHQANHLVNPNAKFFKQIEDIKNILDYNCENMEIYSVVCSNDKVKDVREEIDNCIKNFQKNKNIKYNNISIFSLVNHAYNSLDNEKYIYETTYKLDDISFLSLCVLSNKSVFSHSFYKKTFDIWIDGEIPVLLGKQVITFKFLLNDLNGRRIISSIKYKNCDSRCLAIEGGVKLNLEEPFGYKRENLGINDIGIFSLNDINEITMNPCYALGKFYYPNEIFYFWQKTLLYILAVSNVEWNESNLKKVYQKFLKFIESEICSSLLADPIITENEFYNALCIHIKNTREYLKGNYESVISKDYLLFLRNCRPFFKPIKILLKDEIHEKEPQKFNLNYYKELIKNINVGNNYQKGINLEILIEYLFECTSSFKVMSRRERTSREEIDMGCANVSDDEELWNLGAFLYIECKNWIKKVSIKTIRELGYIMFYKGNTTTILICKNNITKNSIDEIIKLSRQNKFILVLNLDDLKNITSITQFIDILKYKYNCLQKEVENDISIIGE